MPASRSWRLFRVCRAALGLLDHMVNLTSRDRKFSQSILGRSVLQAGRRRHGAGRALLSSVSSASVPFGSAGEVLVVVLVRVLAGKRIEGCGRPSPLYMVRGSILRQDDRRPGTM